jgi:hypothetical protein
MTQSPQRAGICLIKVEAQSASYLITVRRNPDVGGHSADTVTSFSEAEFALEEVRKFLRQFTGG